MVSEAENTSLCNRASRNLNKLTHCNTVSYLSLVPLSGTPWAGRFQLDFYGSLLVAIYLANKFSDPISYELWRCTRKLVEYVTVHWRDPVEGLWPEQGPVERKHYVATKLMCWVALDRGISLAQDRSFPAPLPDWKRTRNEIYCEIQDKGFSLEKQRFRQAYDNVNLDASLLLLPITSFLAPTDPKFLNTLDAILKSTSDGQLTSTHIRSMRKARERLFRA